MKTKSRERESLGVRVTSFVSCGSVNFYEPWPRRQNKLGPAWRPILLSAGGSNAARWSQVTVMGGPPDPQDSWRGACRPLLLLHNPHFIFLGCPRLSLGSLESERDCFFCQIYHHLKSMSHISLFKLQINLFQLPSSEVMSLLPLQNNRSPFA